MGRYQSGQLGQTVNLLALCLRWFESNSAHLLNYRQIKLLPIKLKSDSMPILNPDRIGVGLAKMILLGLLGLAIVVILLLSF